MEARALVGFVLSAWILCVKNLGFMSREPVDAALIAVQSGKADRAQGTEWCPGFSVSSYLTPSTI